MADDVVLSVPGDKSITHRALFLGSLARGTSRFRHLLTGEDGRSAAHALRQVGISISPLREGAEVVVRGRRRLVRPTRTIQCGNSGTTARLLLGLLAAQRFEARLNGDRSLRRRPMRRVTEPLARMGATFPAGHDGLPLAIRGGALSAIDFRSPVASAQVKSALLLAGLAGGVRVTVRQPGKSRDHTERLCRALGLRVTVRGGVVSLEPGVLPAFDMRVPGDPSSAMFLVGAGLLAQRKRVYLPGVAINPTRTGALQVVTRMHGDVVVSRTGAEMGEPVGDIAISPSVLVGTTVEAREIPSLIDEIPMLAVLATRARGVTVFHDVGELRVKESNRLELLAANIRAVGGVAAVEGDTLYVEGGTTPPAGFVQTAGDHRMVMAFAVLRVVPGSRVRLSERASAAVSYPAFFNHLEAIRRATRHRN